MKKKNLLALLLIIVMCTVLSACGESEEDVLAKVDEALQGEWRSEEDESITTIFVFDQGKMEINVDIGGTEVNANTGTYEIGESTIKINYDLGEQDIVELDYSFENNELTLSDKSVGTLYKTESEKTVTNDKSNIERPSEEDIKNYALSELYEWLERVYGEYYDIPATKYKFGSFESNGDTYEVKGTIYLYDEYGSVDESATFNVPVEFQGDGDLVLNGTIEVETD